MPVIPEPFGARALGADAGQYPSFLHEWRAKAAAHPDRVAIVTDLESVSYRQLRSRADRVTAGIVAAGHPAASLIGIHARRSPQVVAAMLGILQAGCAYVPMDPTYPRERLQRISRATEVSLILADAGQPDDLWPAGVRTMPLDQVDGTPPDDTAMPALSSSPPASRLAYVIFTSGTTGQPKGVCTTTANLDHFIGGMIARVGIGPMDVVLATTSICFDPHVVELLLPLTAGACVVLADDDQARSPGDIAELIVEHGVTFAQGTPARWQMMLNDGWRPPHAMTILCGGEAMTPALRDALLPTSDIRLWNVYGPTETTVWCTAKRLFRGEAISLGQPIPGTTLHVLNEASAEAPAGGTGELCIAGPGMMAGYLGQPALTQQSIVPVRGEDGKTRPAYRSGDIVRRLADGTITYACRRDLQVKVRGYRVELLEIEAAIGDVPGVTQAAVIALHGERLVAFIALRDLTSSPPQLTADVRGHLKRTLPAYMLPSEVRVVEALPLTVTNKVDRKALGEMAKLFLEEGLVDAGPTCSRTAAELARLWTKVLGHPPLTADIGFLDAGGHSINAVTLKWFIAESFGVKLPLSVFAGNLSMPALAARIDEATKLAPDRKTAAPIVRHMPLSPSQALLLNEIDADSLAGYNLEFLVAGQASRCAVRAAVEQLIASHDIFRIARVDTVRRRQDFAGETVVPLWDASDTCRSEVDFIAAISSIRAQVCPRTGTLYRFVVFAGPQDCLIYFVANHAIMDEMSIELLKVKLDMLLTQSGRNLPECDSYQAWLSAGEAQYHTAIASGAAHGWAKQWDAIDPWPTFGRVTGLPNALQSRSVAALPIGELHGRDAHDTILAAICFSVGQRFGLDYIPCRLVRNGRGEYPTVDDTFTIGWLSYHYPMIVPCLSTPGLIRDQLRQANSDPSWTAEYGWLRYIGRTPELCDGRPDLIQFPVYFNYLPTMTRGWSSLVDRSHDLPPREEPRKRMSGLGFVADDRGSACSLSVYYDQAALSASTVDDVLNDVVVAASAMTA